MEPKKRSLRTTTIATITAVMGAAVGGSVENLSDQAITVSSDVIAFEEQEVAERGKYEQLLPGGHKPTDADDPVRRRDFPENMRVDVYDGPRGKGYTIVERLPGKDVYISYGPEGEERTKIVTMPQVPSATSSLIESR